VFCVGFALTCSLIHGQSLSIPGVSSKYNSNDTIQKLLEAERIPLQRMQQEQETYRLQKSTWLRLNQQVAAVRDGARQLFGFQNPFDNKVATSTDESVLTATASRTATEQETTIRVKRIAAADRFISKPLPRDFKVPAGTYTFRVGEEELRLSFRGGSLKELAELINARGAGLLKATVVSDSGNTQVLLIESLKTGARNTLSFRDQAADFAEAAGIIEKSLQASRTLRLTAATVEAWQKPLKAEEIAIADDTLLLNPGGEARLPVRPAQVMKPNMVLSLEVRVRRLPEEGFEAPSPPPGPELPEVGGIELQGIRVQSAPSRTVLPPWQAPEPPKRVDDLQILFVEDKGKALPLPLLSETEEFTTLTFDSTQLPGQIDAVNVRNRNTHRVVEVRAVRIYDTTARGDYRAVKPLSTAGDALIVMDGVEVTRETNDIDDLIPGVNLTLRGSSELPVKLTVAKDLEGIKGSLYNFIGFYNQLLMRIDVLTRQDEAVVEQAAFLKEEEREQARKELGLFQGNVALMQLKSQLQRIMMNPYPTDGGRSLSLLAQAGISTSAGQFQSSGTLDRTRLRGYLQIDEAKLEETLGRSGVWVKQLFGNDTDKDLVVDAGAAFQTDAYLRSYVDTGGIIANRVAALDGSISRKAREIEAYNQHLIDYERELRRKFGIMEGALDSLEKSSQALDNLNRRTQ
jgi:flagellar hook-associated protein 2